MDEPVQEATPRPATPRRFGRPRRSTVVMVVVFVAALVLYGFVAPENEAVRVDRKELKELRQNSDKLTRSPSPTPSSDPTRTPSQRPSTQSSSTPAPSASTSSTPSATPSPSDSASSTPTPRPTPSETATPRPSTSPPLIPSTEPSESASTATDPEVP